MELVVLAPRRTVVNEQHSYICVPLIQMGEGSVEGEADMDLFTLYANCRGSSEPGIEEVMNDLTSHSKHFMTMEMSATTQ